MDIHTMNHSDICKHCLEGWGEHEALKNYCPKYDDGGGLYYDKTQTFERLNIREVVAKVSEQETKLKLFEGLSDGLLTDNAALIQQVSEQSQRIDRRDNRILELYLRIEQLEEALREARGLNQWIVIPQSEPESRPNIPGLYLLNKKIEALLSPKP